MYALNSKQKVVSLALAIFVLSLAFQGSEATWAAFCNDEEIGTTGEMDEAVMVAGIVACAPPMVLKLEIDQDSLAILSSAIKVAIATHSARASATRAFSLGRLCSGSRVACLVADGDNLRTDSTYQFAFSLPDTLPILDAVGIPTDDGAAPRASGASARETDEVTMIADKLVVGAGMLSVELGGLSFGGTDRTYTASKRPTGVQRG